ncbi:MAG: NAD(P)H-dependent glycerol-3-phosphate dehydrogenase [Methylococcaceae bacterium]
MANISVLGAGSWGTALAILLARNGHETVLWGHHAEHTQRLSDERCNHRYLPDAPFPDALEVRVNLTEAVEASPITLVAVPSHAFRDLLVKIRPCLRPHPRIAWATKGLETDTQRLLHDIVADEIGPDTDMAVLSGPTFAREVAANLPTAMTVASRQADFAATLVDLLRNPRFRAYSSEDLIGVQLGGATKNVLAIAAGVADGLGFGANARAALITRGLAEMTRLGLALGGRPETFMGLAGVGDLILTCTDNQSRNRRFGLGLGRGIPRSQITQEIGQEIEGIMTARLVYQLAQRQGIDMPITEQTYRVLHQGLQPLEAVENLFLRQPRPE